MTRRYEVFTVGGEWRAIERAALGPGMIFRLFEADGSPVVAEDEATGARVTRWRALAAPRVEDGADVIDAEPIAETSVERAAREFGTYWPNGAAPADSGWAPRRLR